MNTVILGAGLTGLSAAYHGGGIICEKERQIGGTCRSMQDDGYTFDFGIHVLHTKDDYVLNLLSKQKSLGLKRKRRLAWIYSHKTLTKYPFQANTYGLPRKIVMQCLSEFIDTLGRTRGDYDNYEDWIYATFGKGIADNFYLPYSEKFWTVKARELTNDWLDVRVPRPSLEQVIAGAVSVQKEEFGPNVLFRYPQRGGIQKIAEALLKKNVKVMLGKEATRIQLNKKTIHFKDHTAICYDNLVSTIPLPELFNIVDITPKPVLEAVRDLRHNSVFCVNLGIKRENITPNHWIYFPEEKFAAFRISFPKNFSKFTVPKKWSSVQAEISYSKVKPVKHRDIIEKVIKDLIRTKILKPKDTIKPISTKDIKYAYVIHDHNRLGSLRVINKFLKNNGIYNAGRYGEWGYLWMDEAILSGKRIIKEIGRQRK